MSVIQSESEDCLSSGVHAAETGTDDTVSLQFWSGVKKKKTQ